MSATPVVVPNENLAGFPTLKERAIRLRRDERMSLDEIQRILKCSKSNLSLWLRPYPLTREELKQRRRSNLPEPKKKDRGEESKLHASLKGRELTRAEKGRIAEAAVRLRLAVCGFDVLRPMQEDHKADFAVYDGDRRLYHIQVKWVKRFPNGLPCVSMRCSNGRKRFRRDLFTDTAYVYSYDELGDRQTYIAIANQHAEAWEKIHRAVEAGR